MRLSTYAKKRNLKITREPRARLRRARAASPIFVVQKHKATRLHYDFRLEVDGVLKSWAVPKGPPVRGGDKRLAVMVEDHPYGYKDFEGVIPEGNYGAGTVRIWDRGRYRPLGASIARESDRLMRKGLRTGHATFILGGKKLRGEYALIRLRGSKQWLIIKSKKKVSGMKL